MRWLFKPFTNNRGQINLSFLKPLGSQLLQTGSNLLTNRLFGLNQQGLQLGGGQNPTTIPNSLLGGGLLLGGALSDREPGEVTQARQFLRGRFTEPDALARQFSGQVGAISEQFQPLLTQQRQRGIDDISQRFAAAFPKTVGAQGPEFGTLSRYITDEALPREQALLGDIGLNLLNAQERAAGTILGTNQDNALSQALSQLGGSFLMRDLFGGQATQGQGGTQLLSSTGQVLGNVNQQTGQLMRSPTQLGQLNPAQLAQQLGYGTGGLQGSPFVFNAGNGQLVPIGIEEAQQLAAQGYGSQITAQGAGQSAGLDFGLKGAGLLGQAGFGSSGALLSSAGSALGAAGLGYAIGSRINSGQATQAKAGLSGAAAGAAAGFALGGGPIGAVIGAIAGGISGIFGSSKAEQARKESSRQAETQQTNAARPEAIQIQTNAVNTGKQQISVAQQFSSLDATIKQLAASDPEIAALYRQGEQALGANPGYNFFQRAADQAQGHINQITSMQAGHTGDLLKSFETGNFFPGMEAAKDLSGRITTQAQFVNSMVALLQQKGVI